MASLHALPTATDDDLVAAMRAGDDDAFATIVVRYRPALLAHARRILRSPEDAEEIVQDAFIKAHAALRGDDREMSLSAWLHTIVRNRALDRLRRQRPEVDFDTVAPLVRDRSSDPVAAAERRAELTLLVDGIKALPDRQRTALVLHELEGRSHEAVGRCMGVSEGASKTLVCRARSGLRRDLAAA